MAAKSNRQIISDVINFLRANNIDERFSYRYILSELRDAAQTLIKQDTDNRRIYKQTNLWKPLPCGVEMEEVPFIQCNIDIEDGRRMMRSKERLPAVYTTNYGALLNVSTLDGTILKETTFEKLKDDSTRRFKIKENYFILSDGYLFVPDLYVEALRLSGFFKDEDYLNFGSCKHATSCISPLDQEFNCPDYLVKVVKETVQKSLFQSLTRPVDERPNLSSEEKT